ncbi:MAG: two-component system response regulator [Campylobacteraceae bacterium 4484_166]|nr:MAG: two-component system response regulator [Campylobacteraceae bacterium 4484_166]
MRILILEDDNLISSQIKIYFELKNNMCDIYEDGQTLLDEANIDLYDLFLFDINTPNKNGLETLKILRDEGYDTPAIFLTALSDTKDLKLGFIAGCHDYIKKPFDLEEVEIRANKLVYKKSKNIIRIDDKYSFDIFKQSLMCDDTVVDLTKIERDIVFILIKNINNTIPTDIIINYVWQGNIVCDNTLRTHIKKLRDKTTNSLIKNIKNVGYKIATI